MQWHGSVRPPHSSVAAVLRWIESSSEEHSLTRAIEQGDREAITKALSAGKPRVKKRA
jgi:hypothetical protein